jgi:hypothetical protein
MIILLVIAGIAVCASIGGVVLVSLASRHEDSAHSLAGRPSGAMEAAARRVVGFHADGLGRRPGGSGAARPGAARPGSGWAGRGDGGDWLGGPAGFGSLTDTAAPDVPHLVG